MMIEITKAEARKLFSLGKRVYILPSQISHNHETFQRLTVQKDFYFREYPEDRIKEYARIYCNTFNGQEIKYYHDAVKVLISRTGDGFEIKDFNSRERLFIVRGGDSRLVQFVNSRFLFVVNSGYLTAPFKQKFKYS